MADLPNYENKEDFEADEVVKVICLGDSAVGKSKYVTCLFIYFECICLQV